MAGTQRRRGRGIHADLGMPSGLRVRFVANVHVVQAAAERVEQLAVQRARWASGTWQLGKRSAIGRASKGSALTGRVLLADAGWTLLIVSRPLVLLHLSLTLVAAMFLAWLFPSPASVMFLASGAGLVALYAAYFGFGIAKVGFSLASCMASVCSVQR